MFSRKRGYKKFLCCLFYNIRSDLVVKKSFLRLPDKTQLVERDIYLRSGNGKLLTYTLQ